MSENLLEIERMRDRRVVLVMLMLTNAIGLLASMVTVAIAASSDPQIGLQVMQATRHSIRMFVAGAFIPILPAVFCWIEIELQLAWSQKALKWSTNVVMLASGILFLVAGWGLPHGILRALRAG
jgi:hypothetical protein